MKNKPGKWDAFKGIPGTQIPAPRNTRKTLKDKTPEATIQAQAEAYLDACGLFYIRLPDSLMRVVFSTPSIPIWTKREVADCLKGLPDLTILDKERYLAIELKRDGGKMTSAQRDVQRAIGTVECQSFAAFKQAVDNFRVLG